MEHAPLRPVPGRASGPLDAAAVSAFLPRAGDATTHALAAVLSGRPRAEVAPEIGVAEEELAQILAAGRKALRRTRAALPGSGWCERAERLISDRLDGELGARETTLLDVHLRNCPRCVEHERRLVQATDALLTLPAPAPGGRSTAELTVVAETAPVVAETTPVGAPDPEPSRESQVELDAEPRPWHAALAVTAGIVLATLLLLLSATL